MARSNKIATWHIKKSLKTPQDAKTLAVAILLDRAIFAGSESGYDKPGFVFFPRRCDSGGNTGGKRTA
jgi:hypothetical protein